MTLPPWPATTRSQSRFPPLQSQVPQWICITLKVKALLCGAAEVQPGTCEREDLLLAPQST